MNIVIKCACGVPICDTELIMDLNSEIINGKELRGLLLSEHDGKNLMSIVIPEYLAKAIEDAIINHKELK